MLATLHVGDRRISTPFGLVGNDENALTFALGFTFQQCPSLLQKFLREIGINGVRRGSLRDVQIILQRRSRGDRG